MMWLFGLFLFLTAPAIAQEEVVLGLSQDRVHITTNFDGSDLLIFGAVKRETPIIDPPLDVIVTVAGPSTPVTIHQKARRLGIWVNAETVRYTAAPSFYAVATSGPIDDILLQTEDLRHAISVPRMIRTVGAASMTEQPQGYVDALIRIRSDKDHYQSLENTVRLDQQTLFRTRITLPSDLTEGGYTARVFLLREGNVVSRIETTLDVNKVGLERWLYTLAHQKPLFYGILSLSIAIIAGWLASALFRAIRSG
jgi:uncharacterized protein (TIGR02186 family)